MKVERENMSPIWKSIGRAIHSLAEFMEIHVIKQDIEAACKRMKNDWEPYGITLMGNMKSASSMMKSKRLWVQKCMLHKKTIVSKMRLRKRRVWWIKLVKEARNREEIPKRKIYRIAWKSLSYNSRIKTIFEVLAPRKNDERGQIML